MGWFFYHLGERKLDHLCYMDKNWSLVTGQQHVGKVVVTKLKVSLVIEL